MMKLISNVDYISQLKRLLACQQGFTVAILLILFGVLTVTPSNSFAAPSKDVAVILCVDDVNAGNVKVFAASVSANVQINPVKDSSCSQAVADLLSAGFSLDASDTTSSTIISYLFTR